MNINTIKPIYHIYKTPKKSTKIIQRTKHSCTTHIQRILSILNINLIIETPYTDC